MKTTTKKKPTGKEVWEAILTDPMFTNDYPKGSRQRKAIRPFIEASVRVLDDQLENIVTLQTISKATATFHRFCIENEVSVVEVGELSGEIVDIFNSLYEYSINRFELISENTTVFLEKNGLTEEEVMLSPIFRLSIDSQQKWRTGTLTIGELLLTQPMAILAEN